jgi:hypothetical protein
MNASAEDAFDTIESAHDFITLLAETVAEAKRTLETDVQRESSSGFSRHLDTLRVAQYSMAKLETHVNRTGRILNDLRTLRRLLFEERSTAMSANTSTIRSATSAAPPPSTTHNTTLQNVAAI